MSKRAMTEEMEDMQEQMSELESDLYNCKKLLKEMTAARNEVCDIANDLNGDNGDAEELIRRRDEIAQLRKVGEK